MSSAEGPAANPRRGILDRIETGLLCLLLFAVIVLGGSQIVLRNYFSYSLFWADELIRLAVLWLAVLGAMVASKEGRHLAIGIVPRYFPEAWHRPARVIAMAFATIVTGFLSWHAARFVADTRSFGDTVLGGLPAWPFQLILPAGFALMALRFLRHTVDGLRVRR